MGGIVDPHSNRAPARLRSEDQGNGLTIRTRHYFRRCKKVIPTNIEFLPDEVLLEILLLLSTEDICVKARFVCRRWNRIIYRKEFVHSHLHHTNSGLLLSEFWCDPIFMAATKGGIQISNLRHKIRFSSIASCNGLVVGVENTQKHYPYIVNPATNSPFVLPRFFDRSVLGHFGIAYAAASMEYKVVGTYAPEFKSMIPRCAILTVGVDKTWRHVEIDRLSPRGRVLLLSTPKITQGYYMHWVSRRTDVLTLNVETEVMTETHVPLSPQDYQQGTNRFYYLSTGNYLTLLVYCGWYYYLWEVWEMKPGTGEWMKLPCSIDLEAHKCRIHQFACDDKFFLAPVGWVKYPEVLAFIFGSMSRSCIIYNLETDEIDCIQLPRPALRHNVVVHRNSLICLR